MYIFLVFQTETVLKKGPMSMTKYESFNIFIHSSGLHVLRINELEQSPILFIGAEHAELAISGGDIQWVFAHGDCTLGTSLLGAVLLQLRSALVDGAVVSVASSTFAREARASTRTHYKSRLWASVQHHWSEHIPWETKELNQNDDKQWKATQVNSGRKM